MPDPTVAPCKLCGQTKPLIDAHIYPRAIALEVGGRGDLPRTYSVDGSEHPKRTPSGWYDSSILCAECDRDILGPFDQYGIEFLRWSRGDSPPTGHSSLWMPRARPGTDARLLKLFALSLLWRAAVSSRPEFEKARLGPFEAAARAALLAGQFQALDDFALTVTWYPDDPGQAMIPPFRIYMKDARVRAYLMHLGSHSLTVKVDSRATPAPLRPHLVSPDREVSVLVDSVIEGPVGGIIRRFLKTPAARKGLRS
jgi:hypothetical protein